MSLSLKEDVYTNPDDEPGRGGNDNGPPSDGQDNGSMLYGTSAPASLQYGNAGMMQEDPYACKYCRDH